MSSSDPRLIRSGGEWSFGGRNVIACYVDFEKEDPKIADAGPSVGVAGLHVLAVGMAT